MFMQAKWARGYWLPDMSVQCFTGWHLKLVLGLGLPVGLLACVGIPLLPALLLFKHRQQLQTSTAIQARFGFLYRHYRYAHSMHTACEVIYSHLD